MADTTATSGGMQFPPMFRMPHHRQQDGAGKTTDGTSTTASSTATTSASSTTDQTTEGKAPEGFEGFEGKFPNFGGGNMGPGMMPPFGEREAFM